MEYEITYGGEVNSYDDLKNVKATEAEFFLVKNNGRAYMYDKDNDEWYVYGG